MPTCWGRCRRDPSNCLQDALVPWSQQCLQNEAAITVTHPLSPASSTRRPFGQQPWHFLGNLSLSPLIILDHFYTLPKRWLNYLHPNVQGISGHMMSLYSSWFHPHATEISTTPDCRSDSNSKGTGGKNLLDHRMKLIQCYLSSCCQRSHGWLCYRVQSRLTDQAVPSSGEDHCRSSGCYTMTWDRMERG